MSTKLVKRLSGFSDCSRKGVRKVKDLYQFIVNTPEIWEVAYQHSYQQRCSHQRYG